MLTYSMAAIGANAAQRMGIPEDPLQVFNSHALRQGLSARARTGCVSRQRTEPSTPWLVPDPITTHGIKAPIRRCGQRMPTSERTEGRQHGLARFADEAGQAQRVACAAAQVDHRVQVAGEDEVGRVVGRRRGRRGCRAWCRLSGVVVGPAFFERRLVRRARVDLFEPGHGGGARGAEARA